LTGLVDADHAVGCHVADSHEDKLVSDALAVDKSTTRDLVHEEVTKFSHHEDNTEFGARLHQNWEISRRVGSHLNVNADTELLGTSGRVANFDNVQPVLGLVHLFFTVSKKLVLIGGIIFGYGKLSETSGVTFKELLLFALNVVKLHL
jgi:hypothetical protein